MQEIIREILDEFCTKTSVNGVKFFKSPRYNRKEKFIWLLILAAIFYLFLIFFNEILLQVNSFLMVATYLPYFLQVTSLTYPSLSMCPVGMFNEKVFNYTEYKRDKSYLPRGWTRDEVQEFVERNCEVEKNFFSGFTSKVDYIKTLKQVSFKTKEIFTKCIYNGIETSCSNLISQRVTFEGICFTFNTKPLSILYRNAEETRPNLDDESKQFNISIHPEKAIIFHVAIPKTKMYKECNERSGFFSIATQLDTQMVTSKGTDLIATPGNSYDIKFDLQLLSKEESFRPLSPEKRGCHFPDERRLKYFPEYNRHNCELECLSEHTFNICHCVPFFYPKFSNIPTCSLLSKQCISDVQIDSVRNSTSVLTPCGCLLDCYETIVSRSSSYTKIRSQEYFEDIANLSNYHVFVFNFMPENLYVKFTHVRRLHTSTNFISYLGGIVGIFLGVSFVSLYEILYYFTLRPISIWLERRRIKKVMPLPYLE